MVVDGLKTLNNNNSQQYHHIEGTAAEEPPPSKAADHFHIVVSKRPKLPSTNSENKENMFDDTTLIIDGAANNRRRRNGEKYNRSGLAYPPHNIVKEDSCLLCDTLISEQLCYHDDKLKRFHRCHSAKDVLHNNNVNKNNNSISKSNLLTTAEATPLWFHEIQSKTYMFGTAAATTERSSSSSPLVAIDATTKLARKKAYTTGGTITTIINATAASNSDKCNSSSAANPIDDHHQSSILIKSNEFKKNCIANGSNSNDRRNSNSNNIVTTALGVTGLIGGGADKKLVLRFTYDDALLFAVDDLFIQRDMLSFIDNDQPQTKKHAQLIPFTAGSDFLRHIERLTTTTTTNTSLSMERLSELFMMLLETGGCRRSKSYEDRAADTTSDAVEKGGLLLRPFGDNARKLLAANRNEAVRAAGLMIGLLLGFCFHHNGDNTNNVNGCLLLEVVVGSADAANQVVAASSSYFGKTTAKNKIAAETLRRSIDTVSSSSSSGGRRDIVAIKTKSRYFSIGNDIIEKRTIITNRRNRCYDSIKIWDINAFDNDKSNNKRPSDNDNNEHNIRRRKRNDRDAYWSEVSENISKTVADFDDTLDTLEDLIKQFCLESMEMSAAADDDDGGDYVISPSITREGISSQQQQLSEEDDIERYSSSPSYEMKSSYEQDEDVLSEEGGDNSTNDKEEEEDGVYYLSKNNLSPKNFCEYNLWYSPLSETTVIYERLLLRQEDHHRHQLDEDELTSPPLDGGVAANNGTDYKSYHLWGSPLVEGGIFQWIKQNGTDRLLSQQPASSSDPFDAIYNLWSSPDILNCLWSSNDKSNAPASDGRINNNNDITKEDDQVEFDDTNGCHDDHNQWLHSSGFRTSSDVQYFALSTQPELAYSISFENSGMCTSSSSDVVAAREKNRLDENCPMVNDERPADDYFPKPLFDCTIAVVPQTTDQQQPEFKNTLSEDRQDLLNASSVEGFSFFCDHRFNNNNNANNMVDSLNENSSMGSMYSLFGENIDYCNNGSKMKSPLLCNDNRANDRIILNPLTTTFGRYYNSSLGNDDYYPDSCSHGGNNSCDDGDDEDRLLFHDIRQQGRQLEMESYREQSVIATAAANHHQNNSHNILSSIASMFPNPSSSSSSCDLILTKSTRNNEYNLFPNRLATNDQQQQQNSVVDDVLAYLQTAINENRRKNNEENANETVADDEQHKQLMYLDNEVERINFPLSLKISLTPERYLFQPVEPFVDVKLDPAPVYAKSPNGSLYYEGCKVVDFKHPAAGTNNDVFRPKFKIIRQDKASQTDEEPPSYYHHLQQQQQQQQWTMTTDQMYQRNATMPAENNFYQLLNRSNNFKEPSSTTTNVVDELEEPEFLDLPSATAGISFTNIVAI